MLNFISGGMPYIYDPAQPGAAEPFRAPATQGNIFF